MAERAVLVEVKSAARVT